MSDWTPPPPPLEVDQALRAAVRELEAHAARAGWDQPAQLFALVDTADLLAQEPGLVQAMGITDNQGLTAVEQDTVPESALEDTLLGIGWPPAVVGCAAVVERYVLPPAAEEQLPDDPAEARTFAAEHPEHQEVRIVAGATRAGATYCAVRMRSHDDDLSLLEGPDLVPTLLELLLGTLDVPDEAPPTDDLDS